MIPSTEETSTRRQLPSKDSIAKVQAKRVAFNGTKTSADGATAAPTIGTVTVTAIVPTTTATTETPGIAGATPSNYDDVDSLFSEGSHHTIEEAATGFFLQGVS